MAIGLALSGGGLRATLFHLGVVRALRDANVLKDVSHICSVSGGSILAAHLVLHWEDYLGEGFDKRAKEILDFCSFDVRNHIFRRYPNLMARWIATKIVPFRLVRPKGATDLLQEYYAQLYGDATLDQLRAPAGKTRPVLHILTTNLTTATLCSFGSDGFHSEAAPATGRRPYAKVHIPAATPTLCFAVSASSAFPGMFSPLRLTAGVLGKYDAALEPAEQFVTDGGVYDNLGIRKFLGDSEGLNRLERVFVSNAGAELKTGGGKEHVGMIRTALRASDILSHRVHQLESASMASFSGDSAGGKFVAVHIREVVPREAEPEALHENSQDWLRWIRTDLDQFSSFEMHCLIRHGWEVARQSLRKGGVAVDSPPWAPFPASSLPDGPVKQMKALSKSVSRRTRLFSLKDRVSWAHAATLLVVAALLAVGWREREKVVERWKQQVADGEARLAAQREESERRLKISAVKSRVSHEAWKLRHQLSVELSYRRRPLGHVEQPDAGSEKTGFFFIYSREKEWEPNLMSHVSLVTLYSLLRDDAHCMEQLRDDQKHLLTSALERRDFSMKAFKWRLVEANDVFTAWPSLWGFCVVNRLLLKGDRRENHGYYKGVRDRLWRSLEDFQGKGGAWLVISGQQEVDVNHTYVASVALRALLEYRSAILADEEDFDPDLVKVTCSRLVSDWKEWRVGEKVDGAFPRPQGLALMTYASLLKVDEIDPKLAGLTEAMRTEIGLLLADAHHVRGKDNKEPFRINYWDAGRKPQSVLLDLDYKWLSWAIDCAHEWLKYLERRKADDKAVLYAAETLERLVVEVLAASKLVKWCKEETTESLAEIHLVLGDMLSGEGAPEVKSAVR